jgi:hypothetical protein
MQQREAALFRFYKLPLFSAFFAFLGFAAPFLAESAGTFPGCHVVISLSVGLIANRCK